MIHPNVAEMFIACRVFIGEQAPKGKAAFALGSQLPAFVVCLKLSYSFRVVFGLELHKPRR